MPRIVRTPSVIQMESVECGAAALCIILAHYGRFVPLEELRIVCGVSRDGSKASNILKAARAYGFIAQGKTKEISGLEGLEAPYVVFWNFNHFVVIEGFRKNRVYLNDPAHGRRQVSRAEFDQAFTGVVLMFKKGEGFKKGGRPPSAWRALAERLPGARTGIVFVTVASLAAVIPAAVTPAYTRVFFDDVLVKEQTSWVSPLLLAMALTTLVSAALTYLTQHVLLRLQGKLALRGAGSFFRHILKLPMAFFQQRSAGDLATRIGLNTRVASLLSGELASAGTSLVMVLFFAPLLFHYDFLLTLTGLACALGNLILMRFVARKLGAASLSILTDRNKLAGISMIGLQAIEAIKAGGRENDFFANWSGHYAKVFNRSQAVDRTSMRLTTAAGLFAALNGIAMMALGGRRVMDGVLTAGMLMSFQALMGSFLGPFSNVLSLWPKMQSARADLNQLDDVLKNKSLPAAPQTSWAGHIDGGLEIRNLTFGYNRLDQPLISGLNLSLPPGHRVALVGSSGSGKSTVAKVVCGLCQPWEGEILIDGRSRDDFHPRALANALALVDQDVLLIEGSIRKNLTLWDPTVLDSDIVSAAKDASIHDDITQRDGGYDQEIEESGRNFSGGQKQRLEIARALALNPKILVLDEATSALDPATELLISDNIRRRGCSCLIVAHRLSTIRDCDEIIVLEKGTVVERGTHSQMVEAGGHYAKLIAAA